MKTTLKTSAGRTFLLLLWAIFLAGPVGADDPVPAGLMTFFEGTACPPGWREAADARGRLPLFATAQGRPGQTEGEPMKAGAGPRHPFDSSAFVVALKSKWFGGINGCSNPLGAAGSYEWPFQCEDSDGALPYVHYLLCEKQEAPRQAASDLLPYGTYAFFRSGSCPEDWVVEDGADGRFPMPLMTGGEIGTTVSSPWNGGGPRVHSHSLTYPHRFQRKKITPFGIHREGIADPDQTVNPTVGAGRHLILPFIRLLACRKNRFVSQPAFGDLPAGMTIFFGGQECVGGWERVPESAGRFVVAAPTGAQSGQTFGGAALSPGENRTHQHRCKVKFEVRLQNVCLNGGDLEVAAPASGEVELWTTSAVADVPYLQLSHCRWRS